MKNIRKHRNIFVLLALALACTLLFGGCGDAGYTRENYAPKMSYDGADYDYGGGNYDYEMQEEPSYSGKKYEMLAAEIVGDESAGSNLPADRKIIRDAKIVMEVEDVKQAFASILTLLNSFGGYDAKQNVDKSTVTATLKVPAAKLDGFLDELEKEGDVKNRNTWSDDISDKYFDAQIRLTTLEQTLEKYREYLADAEDVEVLLSITREISELTNEIEQLKGSLRRWDSLVEYSTVTLEIYKIYEAPVEERVIEWNSLSLDDMGWFISSGFLKVCNAIFSVFQWIIVSILIISPIVIPIAVVIFLLVWSHKRKVKKNKMLKDINNNTNNNNNSI